MAGTTVLTLGLTACGLTEPASPPAEEGPARSVHHAMGDTQVRGQPNRVVALDSSFIDAATALGANVVGYTTFGAMQGLPPYLGPKDREHTAGATEVGKLSEPSMDRIAALRPDLILSAEVRHGQLYSKLSAIAPTVFSKTTGATWKDNIRLTGDALDKRARADQLIAEYEQRARRIGDEIRAKEGHNPTVSVVRFANEPTVRLYNERSFPGIVLRDAGLARPVNQPTGSGIAQKLSPERIPELDAEHIFQTVYPDEKGQAARTKERFEANPLWGQLQGQRHEVDDLTWTTSVSLQGAHRILDDLAGSFGVRP